MKRAVSVTLAPDNLLWLRAQAIKAGSRSLSDFLDRLVREARANGRGTNVRSVVGTVRVSESDPDLSRADDAIRALFRSSLRRGLGSGRRPRRTARASGATGRRRHG